MARISNAAALVALNAITAEVNTGGTGTLEVRTGAAPATCETADSGTLLATLTLSADAFPDASDGGNKASSAANVIGDDISADAGGIPGHIRVKSGGGTVVFQGTAGGPASGTECEFDKSPFVLADVVKITALTLELAE